MFNIWVVLFTTESGDSWMEVFNENPTDEHLSAYVLAVCPDEIVDGNRLVDWEVTETTVLPLPMPLDEAIPGI